MKPFNKLYISDKVISSFILLYFNNKKAPTISFKPCLYCALFSFIKNLIRISKILTYSFIDFVSLTLVLITSFFKTSKSSELFNIFESSVSFWFNILSSSL